MTLLKTENLCYSFDGHKDTLKNISVEINKGEKIAVIGNNGAGKSTFFLCLNGVLETDGSIWLNGKKILGKKGFEGLRRATGIVFQDADSQIIASTVKAEVAFGVMNLQLEKNEVLRRTEEAMEKMSITNLCSRPPHYLSGGEKRRVVIADIIAMEPEIFIFDEPEASLDPENMEVLENVLESIGNEEKTILMSTHDMDFALKWADRAIVFSEGEIIADDTTEKIFTNDELLKRAGLKKPMIYQIMDVVGYAERLPKNIDDLKTLLKEKLNEKQRNISG
ncbi:MAG: energy-coupling factor ABC transporter ATP-binding protein [Lachnospiraceae bacterium]|nr:energy-coupling factor ABC transporter ATP-binding protein [Lachnospiraceae bacterium]